MIVSNLLIYIVKRDTPFGVSLLLNQRLPITPRWGFRAAKSYARMKVMCGSHPSLRSSVSSHPTFPRPRPGRTLHSCIYNKRDTPFGVSLFA